MCSGSALAIIYAGTVLLALTSAAQRMLVPRSGRPEALRSVNMLASLIALASIIISLVHCCGIA